MDEKLYTMEEIAITYGYSIAHIRRLSSQKKFAPAKRVGRKLYFKVEEVVPALKNGKFKVRRLNLNPEYNPYKPAPAPTELTVTDVDTTVDTTTKNTN
jgi:hypothetical protein